MDTEMYDLEAQIAATHWWYMGRRRLFQQILNRFRVRKTSDILDIGTSTGATLSYRADKGYANTRGVEPYDAAIAWRRRNGLENVSKGGAESLPFPDASFDFVIASDVIEHIDDDRQALREIARVLRPNGLVLITVPAFMALWGHMDEISHHKRRYVRREVVDRLRDSGFVIKESHYFNFLLFPLIAAVRWGVRTFKLPVKNENALTGPVTNTILKAIFYCDVATARLLSPPFGVSVLALGRRPDGSGQRPPGV